MSYRRETRASKAGLFDGYNSIEEGGLRASSTDISENENDKALDSLKDRVFFLKQLSGDIHGEVLSHNRLLDRMGNEMDASRGILSGTLDRFKMVFERKSGRATCKLVGFLVAFFLSLYLLIRVLRHSM
ncbi:bet1-like SNARE 1-2 [Chenopodium quinoa]|uniref:bet1-like SNARE 1-2 n=1 Tax=Chenopodium quinoa TaxID=63459 RepID=UPI000B76E7B8|nr:bet1-like SNARE 1-2 [Chenopodium quinoa]